MCKCVLQSSRTFSLALVSFSAHALYHVWQKNTSTGAPSSSHANDGGLPSTPSLARMSHRRRCRRRCRCCPARRLTAVCASSATTVETATVCGEPQGGLLDSPVLFVLQLDTAAPQAKPPESTEGAVAARPAAPTVAVTAGVGFSDAGHSVFALDPRTCSSVGFVRGRFRRHETDASGSACWMLGSI